MCETIASNLDGTSESRESKIGQFLKLMQLIGQGRLLVSLPEKAWINSFMADNVLCL